MTHPRYKRNERLYQIALRSDWTYSAKLAVAGWLIGVLAVPMLLGGTPELAALARTVHFLGWVFALGFAGIGLYRFIVQRRAAPEAVADEAADKEEP